MVAHTARCLLSRATWTDLRTCLVVAIRFSIVPIVREALKLMRLFFSVLAYSSASFGTGRTSYLAFGNSCAARYLAMDSYYDRQSWVLFGWRVNPAVTCSVAWTYGFRCFIWTFIVLVATSSAVVHLAVLVFCYFLRFSQYAGLRNHGLGTPLGCPVLLFLLRCSDLITAYFTV